MTCRQCPGYKKDFSPAPWICGSTSETAPTPGDRPSTSSDTCTGSDTGLYGSYVNVRAIGLTVMAENSDSRRCGFGSHVIDDLELIKAELRLNLIGRSQTSSFFSFLFFISKLNHFMVIL